MNRQPLFAWSRPPHRLAGQRASRMPPYAVGERFEVRANGVLVGLTPGRPELVIATVLTADAGEPQ